MKWLNSSTPNNELASCQFKLDELCNSISQLKELVPSIYTELNTISNIQLSAIDEQAVCKLDDKRLSLETSKQNVKSNQECNTYAIGVWKRISQKLDGKDPDPNRSLNVEEQVRRS
jgi:hypothetical protein